uniref:VWA domain-containing protein n=1 Tax=Ningiella ruwaisensis TaxID=2364274 RepID=UPI00109F23F5|nr:VWA domain-containing protein [Ningiella ruwaisensis]
MPDFPTFANFAEFHFLRPHFLWLLAVFAILVFVWMRFKLKNSEWQQILPHHLHQRLVVSKGNKQSRAPFIWLFVALCIASIALAGPSWEKLPQPVYQSESGKVVVMDMSLSMRATDVSPNRLSRARFKAIDLIKEINDGEVGLVAYASDAFTISPLTDDISNLENLIPSLSPEIMPNSGSNPLAGLKHATELLQGAGYQSGHVYWITDGIESDQIKAIRDFVNTSAYAFSALLIGSEDGAPIKLKDGSLLKDNRGSIVIPRTNPRYLEQALNASNARVSKMSIDSTDVDSMILASNRLDSAREQNSDQQTGDTYKDAGIYLTLLLLPIAALLFRRGLLFVALLSVMLPMSIPQPVFAQSDSQRIESAESDDASLSTGPKTKGVASALTQGLRSLFLNDDQRGKEAFDQQDYKDAQNLFDDINWRAAAAYKSGDYEKALELYSQADGIDSIYNRGNALAKLQQLQKALEAYNKVLSLDPEHEAALKNKSIVEELLEQQQQEQNNQQSQSENQSQQDKQSQNDSGEGDQEQSSDTSNQENQQRSERNSDQNNESDQNQDQQSNDNQNGQQNNQQQAPSPEQLEQENNKDSGELEGENAEQNQASAQGQMTEENSEPAGEQQAIQAINPDELSPEEREQIQRMQTLLNKVPDDPAYLLQRKMLLEAQRRKQYSAPQNQEQEW